MSPAVIAKAADLLAALGEDVSVRAVCRVLKAANGKAARWSQIRAVVKAWELGEMSERATPGQHPGTVGQQIDEEQATVGQQALPTRDNCTLFDIPSGSKEPSGSPRQRKPKKEPDTAWCEAVMEGAAGLFERPMSSWSIAERFTWAQWHCYTFGNCNKSEAHNRTNASKVAAGIATMAMSENHGHLTGRNYRSAAVIIHNQRNGKPWFDPWLIRGALSLHSVRTA